MNIALLLRPEFRIWTKTKHTHSARIIDFDAFRSYTGPLFFFSSSLTIVRPENIGVHSVDGGPGGQQLQHDIICNNSHFRTYELWSISAMF